MNNKNSLLFRFFILFVAVLMAVLPTLQASAALVKCRTDPVFNLSNGVTVTVTLDVNTDTTNVKSLNYVLHVPTGVTASKVTFTGGFTSVETYKIIQDSPAKTYTMDTLITTSVSNVSITTKTDVVSKTANGSFAYSNSSTGLSGNHIIVTVKVLI